MIKVGREVFRVAGTLESGGFAPSEMVSMVSAEIIFIDGDAVTIRILGTVMERAIDAASFSDDPAHWHSWSPTRSMALEKWCASNRHVEERLESTLIFVRKRLREVQEKFQCETKPIAPSS